MSYIARGRHSLDGYTLFNYTYEVRTKWKYLSESIVGKKSRYKKTTDCVEFLLTSWLLRPPAVNDHLYEEFFFYFLVDARNLQIKFRRQIGPNIVSKDALN